MPTLERFHEITVKRFAEWAKTLEPYSATPAFCVAISHDPATLGELHLCASTMDGVPLERMLAAFLISLGPVRVADILAEMESL